MTRIRPARHLLRHGRRPLEVWTAGDGPPVVLLHGWGLSGRAYLRALRALAALGRRAVAPSLAVVGEDWTLERVAERAAEAMAAVDAAPAPVVGHSFGGAVAVRLAVDRPDFVSRLVLADAVGISPGFLRLARIAAPGRQWRVAANLPSAAALIRTAVSKGGVGSLAGAARFVLREGLEDELATLRDRGMPAAVLWAAGDTVLPRSVGEREAALLGCRLQVVGVKTASNGRRPTDHDWPFRSPALFAHRVLRAVEESPPA